MAETIEYARESNRRHGRFYLWSSVTSVLLAVYILGYCTAHDLRRPMANMAYYRYTYNPRVDAFCYWTFLPLRKLEEALNNPGVTHMEDRVYGPPIQGP
jgi:hypothetical protein